MAIDPEPIKAVLDMLLNKGTDFDNLREAYFEEIPDAVGDQEISDIVKNRIDELKEQARAKIRLEIDPETKEKILQLMSSRHGEDVQKGTELIVEEIENKHTFYTTREDLGPQMFIYDNGIYVENGRCFIKEFVREVLGDGFTTYRANNVIERIEADTFIDKEQFFSRVLETEVAVQNGILNIETGELNPFTPEKIFFDKFPIRYDPEKICPNTEKFIEEVVKYKEDIPIIFQIFGYSLLASQRFHKAFMFVGDGRNGKSKTIDLMRAFAGPQFCSNVSLHHMEGEPYSLSEMHGKRFNFMTDTSNESLKDTSNFKSITGGDEIDAMQKFKGRLRYLPYAKIVGSANTLPMITGADEDKRAFWDRWFIIEFPYTFVDKEEYDQKSDEEKKSYRIRDTNILKKITTQDELSGLLNKALDAVQILLKNDGFDRSKTASTSEELKIFWRRKSNTFEAFFMDCLEEDYESETTKEDVRTAYGKYCIERKIKPISDMGIKITIEKHGGWEVYRRIENERIRFWKAIKFKEGANPNEKEFSVEREWSEGKCDECHSVGEVTYKDGRLYCKNCYDKIVLNLNP